jgi:transcriptional regulator with PAS, ATPase and Fis domain
MSDALNWKVKLGKTSPLYHQMRSPLRLHLLKLFTQEPARVFDSAHLSQRAGILIRDIMGCLAPMIAENIVEEVPIPGGRGYRLHNAGDHGLLETVNNILDDNSNIVDKYAIVRDKYFSGMIGIDEKMKIVFEMIHTIARSDATVLIIGETGTGKELVASAIHELSSRAATSFHAVNCATLPETLFEAEMFGYEKGAFTGAYGRKLGRFEQADGGTLFLDELGELTIPNQVKLLRVLQDKSFQRLGGNKTIRVDVRLIAATNRLLDEMIHTGEFREDLYYRINVFPIHLPSLRERKDDIPVLATDFLQRHCQENFGDPWAKVLSDDGLAKLMTYDWPGNVRELENIITRLAFTTRDEEIGAEDVGQLLIGHRTRTTQTDLKSLKLEDVEQQHIKRVLRLSAWNIKKASEILGISRVTLYKKIKSYNLSKPADSGQSES